MTPFICSMACQSYPCSRPTTSIPGINICLWCGVPALGPWHAFASSPSMCIEDSVCVVRDLRLDEGPRPDPRAPADHRPRMPGWQGSFTIPEPPVAAPVGTEWVEGRGQGGAPWGGTGLLVQSQDEPDLCCAPPPLRHSQPISSFVLQTPRFVCPRMPCA